MALVNHRDSIGSHTASPSERHLKDVADAAAGFAEVLGDGLRASVRRTAERHDWGKADARFQALLRSGDRMAAQFAPISEPGLRMVGISTSHEPLLTFCASSTQQMSTDS